MMMITTIKTKMNSTSVRKFSCWNAFLFILCLPVALWAQPGGDAVRQRISLDADWKFALGHAHLTSKDFDHATNHFSYLAKAGYGDGAAAQNFDDRGWRKVNIPHDWCVELPFDQKGSISHGHKAIGPNFPEHSVGWYRKKFYVPASDLGKRISIEFDGVHRNSIVWVNGFYLGRESSGYASFRYDISEYLNYGGDNVIAVRADATIEEGWYYEGAGIYRHVWLTKTNPLHVAWHGTFVTTDLKDNKALITSRTTVVNEANKKQQFEIEEIIVDAEGKTLATATKKELELAPGTEAQYFLTHQVAQPRLWSLENPYLHKLKTVVRAGGKIVDTYETTFGIRTVRFDAKAGFFLNGKPVKILGTNNHQDHAGVGTAIPDALQEFRIKKLKEMGSNAIRTSHNPPTPEFLDACDRMGVLVLNENRLMGVNPEHNDLVARMMKRDRNHPSVILWSLGNEEWHIEGDIRGARLAEAMQNYAQRLDSSRAFTIACSGGWDTGIGMVTQVMGYNYISHGDVDEHHAKFPWQASIGTEESNTTSTRGIYETDEAKAYLAPYDSPTPLGAEIGWKFYAERPFLAGLFYWTGFDYRGEPTPFGWPAVVSQFGIVDLCGYEKDIYYYFKSWWSKEQVLHIFPHWNWKGKEGKKIPVTVYSNSEQVELFLNNKSLGKKTMPANGHLTWEVAYQPGVLMAKGFKAGKLVQTTKIETTTAEDNIQLIADRTAIAADGKDVSVIEVQINDAKKRRVPMAGNEIQFSISGPGKIIGVGNGDPSSHAPEQFLETVKTVRITQLKELTVEHLRNRPEVAVAVEDANWKPAFSVKHKDWKVYTDSLLVVRGSFELPAYEGQTVISLFAKSILENQSIYVNGQLLRADIKRDDSTQAFVLDHKILKPGKNVYAVVGQRFKLKNEWEEPNTDPGLIQLITPPASWKRKAFNGLAQVIVQSDTKTGEIVLNATSPGLKPATIKIKTK
jgi:beta-galactosidase